MAIDYVFEKREGYLFVAAAGTFDRQEAIRTFPHILDACLEHQVSHVLIDLSQLQVQLPFSTLDMYEYCASAAQNVVDYGRQGLTQFRIAFIGTVAQMDPGHFAETVFRNRGVNAKGTTDLAEALAFLTGDDAGPAP